MQLNEREISVGEILENNRNALPDGVLAKAKYTICSINKKNRNNRIYEKAVWENVIKDSSIQEKLKNRSLFSHAEHPTTTQSNTEKVAGIVTSIEIDEKTGKVYSIMEVLDTPYGKIIETLLKAHCGIGVSTRADGELEEALDETGNVYHRVVPEKYRFITVDWTADPSNYGSELPLTVEREVASTIKSGLEEDKIDLEYATVLLEKMKAPEAVALLESLKKDPKYKNCKITEDGKKVKCEKIEETQFHKCEKCGNVWDAKKGNKCPKCGKVHEAKTTTEEILINPTIPVDEISLIGQAVRHKDRVGVISHIFPRTKKAIIQFANTKATVNINECKVIKEEANSKDIIKNKYQEELEFIKSKMKEEGIDSESESENGNEKLKENPEDNPSSKNIKEYKFPEEQAGEEKKDRLEMETNEDEELEQYAAENNLKPIFPQNHPLRDKILYDTIKKQYYDRSKDAYLSAEEAKKLGLMESKIMIEKIVKVGNKYKVVAKSGRNMGTYNTKEEAEKRLAQIEMFKHLKESLSKEEWAIVKQAVNDVVNNFQKITGVDPVEVIDPEGGFNDDIINKTAPSIDKYVSKKYFEGDRIEDEFLYALDDALLNKYSDEAHKRANKNESKLEERKCPECGHDEIEYCEDENTYKCNKCDYIFKAENKNESKEYELIKDLVHTIRIGNTPDFKKFDKVGLTYKAQNKIMSMAKDQANTVAMIQKEVSPYLHRTEADKDRYNYKDNDVKEDVDLDIEVKNKIEQFLLDNAENFASDEEARDSLVKIFKIGEKDAEKYIKAQKQGDTDISAEYVMNNEKNENNSSDTQSQLKEVSERLTLISAEKKKIVENYAKDCINFTNNIKMLTNDIKLLENDNKALETNLKAEKNINTELTENLKKLEELNKNLISVIEEKSKANKDLVEKIEELKIENQKLTEKLDNTVNEIKEKHIQEIQNLKETHRKELISTYVNSKVKNMGLKLHQNILTLLENCSSVEEVDNKIEEVQNSIREGIVQSTALSEIIVNPVPEKQNKQQQKINKHIGNALKAFGI